jgi:THO complex subunit 7
MSAIRMEYDHQKRSLNEQRQAFKSVVTNLGMLQLTGRTPLDTSRSGTPAGAAAGGDQDVPISSPLPPLDDEHEEGEEGESSDDAPLSAVVNPRTRSFKATRQPSAPVLSVPAVRGLRGTRAVASAPVSTAPSPAPSRPEVEDDIEMGELTEPKHSPRDLRAKKPAEELEEGEASDVSSMLSDLPED